MSTPWTYGGLLRTTHFFCELIRRTHGGRCTRVARGACFWNELAASKPVLNVRDARLHSCDQCCWPRGSREGKLHEDVGARLRDEIEPRCPQNAACVWEHEGGCDGRWRQARRGGRAIESRRWRSKGDGLRKSKGAHRRHGDYDALWVKWAMWRDVERPMMTSNCHQAAFLLRQ
jgi:hypothetical protein